MKKWEKICLIASAVCLALTILIFIQKKNAQEQRACALCDMIPHHAPCLIDLETGEWVELNIYLPHETIGGELADPQPYTSYFSFISFSDFVGTKTTDPPIINIDIPHNETVTNPKLCGSCSDLLAERYKGRYVLADTYDIDAKILFPIENGVTFSLRCYDISMTQNTESEEITVTVHGTLDIKKNEEK